MKVKDIMTKNVVVIQPDNTVQEAGQKMRDFDIGIMPVCENDRIEGMLTDRDIVVRSIASGQNPVASKVRDVMSTVVFFCYEEESLEEAGKIMKLNQVHRLIVMDHNKRITGILSLGDLILKSGDDVLAGEILKRISEHTAQNRRLEIV
jgi:CBS domain-containing protein